MPQFGKTVLEACALCARANQTNVWKTSFAQGGMQDIEIEAMIVAHDQHEGVGGGRLQFRSRRTTDDTFEMGERQVREGAWPVVYPADMERQRRQRQRHCPAYVPRAKQQ